MKLLVVGDTHGNLPFLRDYVYPLAAKLSVDRIVQVGDFGYWEHDPSGVDFLDKLNETADRHGIPLCWLHGNHDKHSLALKKYMSTGASTPDRFLTVREHILYIPQGKVWTWEGVTMRAFGGAYSVDKQYRLDLERKRTRKLHAEEDRRRDAGEPVEPYRSAEGTLWFPEEQMSEEEMDAMLALYAEPVDIVFSHDFPARANPGEHFKTLPECLPNQQRLQRALDVHRPQWWFHGHLHQPYTDEVLTVVDDDWAKTTVVGLGCDWDAAPRFVKPWHALAEVTIEDGQIVLVRFGHELDAEVSAEDEE